MKPCTNETGGTEIISEFYLKLQKTQWLLYVPPSGYYMHHHFNFQQLYVLPTRCIYVFCIYLRTNSVLCHLQHKLIGFYNRDEKCLQCGTDWVFKYNSGLNKILRSAHTVYLCVLCGSQNKQPLFPYTTLTGWFL